MNQRTGKISVNTTDIFPIIKKWLYSEHDIFLRELVSNSCDAILKRSTLLRGQNVEVPEGKVNVVVDKENLRIIIEDNGLGMTESEVEKYIAQLAFSGAEEFVKKMQDMGADHKDDIIGKFGLGFYSSFMVADKVEIESLSYVEGSKPTLWVCEGNTDYTFQVSTRQEVGTKITLYVNEDGKEFLEGHKTREVLTRYSRFMPYKIQFLDIFAEKERKEREKAEREKAKAEGKEESKEAQTTDSAADEDIIDIINETTPLWKKDPSTLKDEDYKNFYQQLFPFDQPPLFWLHLKVDHPFELQGILYFPKLDKRKPLNDSNIALYSKQVYVSDNIKNIIPEFLGLLKGAIDSVDIPLNVSRSALQGDPNIKKISNYIIKKVGDALKTLFRKDREKFNTIWEDIGLFVKYGVISDTKFDEIMREFLLFPNSKNELMTLKEYQESIPKDFQEKLKNKYLTYDIEKSDETIKQQLLDNQILSLGLDDYIDPHLTQHLEFKKAKDTDADIKFAGIATEIENLLTSGSVSDKDIKVKEIFQEFLAPKKKEDEKEEKKDSNAPGLPTSADNLLEIEIKNFKNYTNPAYIKIDESMKRFQQMSQTMGQNSFNMPIKKTLIVNPTNPLIQNALKIYEKGDNKELVHKICTHVKDLAAISGEGLNNEERDQFVKRSQELIQELSNFAL